LYVQISSFSGGEGWGLVRDAQPRALALCNTAMAVTLDVGDAKNMHPADKQTVSTRLALAARHMVDGKVTRYLGPLFREAKTQPSVKWGEVRIWFDNADGRNTHDGKVEGFEIAGADHRFVPATGVTAARFYVQHMKTNWGSCNLRAGAIRLNTELAKNPRSAWNTSWSTN